MRMTYLSLQGTVGAYLSIPFPAEHLMPGDFNERQTVLRTALYETVKLTKKQDIENKEVGQTIHLPVVPPELQQRLDALEDELQRILPQQIKAKFDATREVIFSAKPANYFKWRGVGLDGAGGIISLKLFFFSIGITPQELTPIFGGEPKDADDYNELGGFGLTKKPFALLAKLLQKPIKVMREDGPTGEHYHLFTVNPDGMVVEAKQNAT